MAAPYEGGCLCGAIRYRLNAEPLTFYGRHCTACITRVWSGPPKFPQVINLRPGTLDDVARFRPAGHIWTRSAQPWVTIPSDTLSYEGQPPDMAPMIRAFCERLRA